MALKFVTLFLVSGNLGVVGAERMISVLSGHFVDYFSKVENILWKEKPVFLAWWVG